MAAMPERGCGIVRSLERNISFDPLESLKDGRTSNFLPQRTITSFERDRPFSDPLPNLSRNFEVGHFHYFGPREISIYLFPYHGDGDIAEKKERQWREKFDKRLQRYGGFFQNQEYTEVMIII